jgi:hypothetical protein
MSNSCITRSLMAMAVGVAALSIITSMESGACSSSGMYLESVSQ